MRTRSQIQELANNSEIENHTKISELKILVELSLISWWLAFYHYQGDSSAQQDSTWKNVLKKLKTMAPYVWPKGSWWRQVIVLVCLVLLGAGRGINVLVPLYNKYIGRFFFHGNDLTMFMPKKSYSFQIKKNMDVCYNILMGAK